METPSDRVRASWREHASMKDHNDKAVYRRVVMETVRQIEKAVALGTFPIRMRS